jgi:hypothetical protein
MLREGCAMTEGSGERVLLATVLSLIGTAATAYGQESPLKVEVETARAVVKNTQDFVVSTTVENVGKEDQLLHIGTCSYAEQWTTDNPSVHVKNPVCRKNPLMDIRLRPGGSFKRPLAVTVSLPAKELRTPLAVSFRLGFSPMDEVIVAQTHPNPPSHSAPAPPIWSNVVTRTVR